MSDVAASVIVPARNAAATLGRTLAALAEQDFAEEYEVIVVDDGSTDETVAIAERAGARVVRQAGLGPGRARNLGAAEARGGILAFTDADCFPEPGWLRAGISALAAADLVQGCVLPDPEAARRPFDHTIWVVEESGLYETANLFVRREMFERVGGFEDWLDVEIGKRLGEDVWFGWQARRRGARTAFAERALVHHAVFHRRWHEYVAERRRLVYFPALVRRIPELRHEFLRGRVFVTTRAAAFAVAVAGAGAAVGLAAAGEGSAAVAVGFASILPYAILLTRRALDHGRFGPKVGLVDLAADCVGFAALVLGSIRARRLVL